MSALQLLEVTRYSRYARFRSGQVVLTTREKTAAIFLVVRGSLKVFMPNVSGPEALLNIVGPGEILGEIHFMDDGGHSAEVAALETCELVRIEHGVLSSVCDSSPKLRYCLEHLTTQRVRMLSRRQAWMATASTNERVAQTLLHFAERYAAPAGLSEAPVRLPLRLSQSDLGALAGASRYRVHLCLHALCLQQLLRLESQSRLTIINPRLLQRWCEAQGKRTNNDSSIA